MNNGQTVKAFDQWAEFRKRSEALRAAGYFPQLAMQQNDWKCTLSTSRDPRRGPASGSGENILEALLAAEQALADRTKEAA